MPTYTKKFKIGLSDADKSELYGVALGITEPYTRLSALQLGKTVTVHAVGISTTDVTARFYPGKNILNVAGMNLDGGDANHPNCAYSEQICPVSMNVAYRVPSGFRLYIRQTANVAYVAAEGTLLGEIVCEGDGKAELNPLAVGKSIRFYLASIISGEDAIPTESELASCIAMVEYGDEPTEYEPYMEPIELGTVTGISETDLSFVPESEIGILACVPNSFGADLKYVETETDLSASTYSYLPTKLGSAVIREGIRNDEQDEEIGVMKADIENNAKLIADVDTVSANPTSTTATLTSITINGVSYALSGSGSGGATLVETTQSALRTLRDSNGLTAGAYYRITDYQAHATSALLAISSSTSIPFGEIQNANEGQFDIVLLATGSNTLGAEGFVVAHSGDTYFSSCDLSKWKVWLDLDGDTSKYNNAVSGYAYVYRLIDEWGNDLSYDFKNIKIKRYKATHNTLSGVSGYYAPMMIDLMATMMQSESQWTISTSDSIYVYTFSELASGSADKSLDGTCSKNVLTSNVEIGPMAASSGLVLSGDFIGCNHFVSSDGFSATGSLMMNNFEGTANFNNTLEGLWWFSTFLGDVTSTEFGGQCYSNLFVGGCWNNTFSGSCYNNTFSGYCWNNTFSGSCSRNTFSGSCYNNTFGGSNEGNEYGGVIGCDFDGYFQNNTFTGNANYAFSSTASTSYCSLGGCSFSGGNTYITCSQSLQNSTIEGRHTYINLAFTSTTHGLKMAGEMHGTSSSYASITAAGLYYGSTKLA